MFGITKHGGFFFSNCESPENTSYVMLFFLTTKPVLVRSIFAKDVTYNNVILIQ